MSVTLRTSIVRLFAGCLLIVWATCSAAQSCNENMAFDFVFDLGGDATQAFLQDRDGFLWFGSAGGGLFRYDGYQLRNYGIGADGLPNGNVYQILEDTEKPGILWIVTLGDGFTRFDTSTDTFTHYAYEPNTPEGLAAASVSSLLQDRQDPSMLWILGAGLLQHFNKETGTFSPNLFASGHPSRPEHPEFYKLLQDAHQPNVLWLAGYGLARFDTTSGSITVYRHDPEDANSLGFESNYIGAIEQDRDEPNILWLGYWDGPRLDQFDTATDTFTHYAHDPGDPASLRDKSVQLIYDDGEGTLWLGGWADANGLTAFDKQNETFTTWMQEEGRPRSLSSTMIVNAARDRSGRLWIVHQAGKVDKYDPYTQYMTLLQHNPMAETSLVDDTISSLYEDQDGMIWIGTTGGLSRFDRTTGTFVNYTHHEDDPDSLDSDHILDTYQDSSGAVWLGAYNSPLLKFDQDTGTVDERIELPQGSSIADIIEDPQNPNLLWLGGVYIGFARFEKSSRTLTCYPPNPDDVQAGVSEADMTEILHDSSGPVIWLGSWSGGGLNKFEKATETFTFYRTDPSAPHSLSSNQIGDLYQDESGMLWIGTRGGGLNRFDPGTERFIHYGEHEGVPAMVNGILPGTRGTLWLSTNDGIVQFNPAAAAVETHFTRHDGLQGDAFSPGCRLKTQDGTLWFGGTNGMNAFHPSNIVKNPHIPPVVLTALTQGGEAVKWDENIVPERLEHMTLNWRNNFFEFEYAALNYTIPEKNQYRYKLEGLDKSWYDAGTKRTGRYSGVPAGDYTLRIIGSNNDSIWNENGVSLAVTVIPPFWQTAWFKFLVIVLIAGTAFGTYHTRMRRVKKQKEILEIQVRERTEELYQAKKRAEEAMYETERRFRVIFNQTFQFIGLANPDGTVRELNHTAIEFFQTDEAQITGNMLWEIPWFDLPEEQKKIRDAIRQAAEGEFVRLETSAAAPNGDRVILDLSFKPLWGEFENIYLLILEGRDLTDYRRTQEALLETTKVKERFESELRIAHDIQMEIIPRTFPPFPDRPEFDIYAELEPAKAVGGDLYDFFFIDEDHLCFVIGDVSDKGVPAALFMSAAKTLIKAIATQMFSYQPEGQYIEPRMDKVLDTVNYELSIENDACMFVTVFSGILNTRTGDVCYTNAGHNAPLLLRPGQEPVFIQDNHCSIIGADEDDTFTQDTFHIEPGDTILMYTDGVTEAMNPDRDMYEEERLKAEVSGYQHESAEEIVKKIVESVHRFAGDMPQNDDITVLALTYKR